MRRVPGGHLAQAALAGRFLNAVSMQLADSLGLIRAQMVAAICFTFGSAIAAISTGPAALQLMCTGRMICGIGERSH
jgi:Sugar (and other) transporter